MPGDRVQITTADPWRDLRRLTAARIGLARAGASLATGPLLEFQLAHARARDAVHQALDRARLISDLENVAQPVLEAESAAADRKTYLMRPDLGRRLSPDAEAALKLHVGSYDAVFVVSDGLSAGAVQAHAAPVLAEIVPALRKEGWRVAPPVVAHHGRVAIGDAVANSINAGIAVVLIGERPGLSAPDSMGAYLTWRPSAATADADRNCISNIRLEGIGYGDAAIKIMHLLRAMRRQELSGVRLKDDSDRLLIGGG